MIRIGDFSRLSQVPIKTLRYYDELGLLRPSAIDEFTSYRYYSADQMPRLNRIVALKDLGFSLEQIRRMLDDGLTVAEMRGMLKMRKAEIQRRLLEDEARLARIEARLSQIESEDRMPEYDVIVKKIEPQQVVYLRDVVESYSSVGELFERLCGVISTAGIRPAGPLVAVYYDPEYKERDVDVAAAMPIAGSVKVDTADVVELEGIQQAACVIHRGSYSNLIGAYRALTGWIESNGYSICGPNREVYLVCCDSADSEEGYVTEVQIPVVKA